jgi:cyclophilin family peptidyl-prolyl cis-trans isomerase
MKLFFVLMGILLLTGCTSGKDNNKVTYYNTVETETTSLPVDSADNNQNSMTPSSELKEDLTKIYSGAVLTTSQGKIELAFYPESPVTVNNFLTLAQTGFYDGTLFHRVITDFMIQGGDPNSKNADRSTHGMGGPGYKFADEFNDHKLVRGSLAMANSGPNTNGSQFFIVTAKETPWLDGLHTNFGYVKSGMEVVEKIEKVAVDASDHPVEDIKIEKIELVKK